MTQNGHQIQVRNLWKVFGNNPERALAPEFTGRSRVEIQQELDLVVGLRDVSFDVDVGQIFVVMGLSGSGKSTLVRCLIRLIEATDGQVLVDGENVMEYSPDDLIEFRRNKVAMVFQHFGLLPHRRVLDNVAYGLEVQGISKQARYEAAEQAIETVGLKGWESYYPREMSGGMQQRVGLARALAVNPEILLMDEPFSGLDPLIRREMQDELINLQKELHKTILFITHDLDEALKLGDRILILRDGEIVQLGTPQEIVTRPADDYVAEFVQDVSRSKVIHAQAIMDEPDIVVHEGQAPQEALRLMQSNNVETAFLVNVNSEVKGVVTRELASRLAQRQEEHFKDAKVPDAFTVSHDMSLEDIIPAAAATEYPIAVVDEDRKLIGEIQRGTLLASLAGNGKRAESAEGE